MTGEVLSDLILFSLYRGVFFLCGQSYDGAGAMAGHIVGVAAQVQAQYTLGFLCALLLTNST